MKVRTTSLVVAIALAGSAAYAMRDRPTTPTAPVAAAPPPAAVDPSPPPTPSPVHSEASVTGTVAETMQVASYTYVRLTTPDGDKWAAIPQATLAVGDTATIQNPMVIDGFKSPKLGKTFDHILFGTLAGKAATAAPADPNADPHARLRPGAAQAGPAPSYPPLPKAQGPGAHTVAEILAGRASLKDKPVVLRGRVTKANGGILGKNWIHLADGSANGTGDGTILVTTQATPKLGDIVVVKGVVRTDKDFGAGYSYPVMIEDGAIAD
jgi:hypothetical protein